MIAFNHLVFKTVAQQLSFTKASEVLFISQPAVSKHIRHLEEHYRVKLFERNGNAITLTAAGKILFQHLLTAEAISKQVEFDLNAIQHKDRLRGELRLGGSTTVALYILPPVLSAFRKQYPEVKVSLLNRNSENVLKALLNSEIDLAIIEGKNKMHIASSLYFLTDEVVPVCSAKSNLAKKTQYTLEEIIHQPIALRERGSGTLDAIKAALLSKDIKLSQLKVCMRLGGTEALKNFLLADDCLGFLPMKSVAKELMYGDLVRLFVDELTITRQFYFTQRRGEENTGLNTSFIRFAQQYYNQKL
jgi:DNA-binding transcriptional LysR family regulator